MKFKRKRKNGERRSFLACLLILLIVIGVSIVSMVFTIFGLVVEPFPPPPYSATQRQSILATNAAVMTAISGTATAQSYTATPTKNS